MFRFGGLFDNNTWEQIKWVNFDSQSSIFVLGFLLFKPTCSAQGLTGGPNGESGSPIHCDILCCQLFL